MGILIVNSDFERIWNEPMPSISFDNATYSLAGEVGTTLSASFAIFDNKDVDVTDQCEITLSNDNVSIEDGMFVCDDLEVGTYQTIATATYSYKSATVTATATINISVEEEQPTSISFNSASYTITGNEHAALSAQFNVADNLGNDITSLCAYSFSPNDKGVYADGGYFKVDSAVAGTYNITVTATYGQLTNTATIAMSVVDYPDSISFDSNSYTMSGDEGDTITQAFTVTDDLNNNVTSQCTYAFSPNNTGLIVSGSSFDASNVAEGTYSVTVTATYASGNGSTLTATATISIEVQSASFANKYLTTEALGSGRITLSIPKHKAMEMRSISYSLDNGETWTTQTISGSSGIESLQTTNLTQGDIVLWKGTGTGIAGYSLDTDSINRFSATCNFNASGNVMSLLYGDNFRNQTTLPGESYQNGNFANLFRGCTRLISAENLVLPATTLKQNCYQNMFVGCTSLTTAPTLPATTLANYCYANMFDGCTSLATAPTLPATTLANYCYNRMFSGTNVLPDCSNIDFTSSTVVASGGLQGLFAGTKVTYNDLMTILPLDANNKPCLPATTLAQNCYNSMFYGCKALTTAPELPATTLAQNCYSSMFSGCTSLTTAPVLNATTLAYSCYKNMFYGCTSLTTAPVLPATTLASFCYQYMFSGCTGLTTAPALSATTLASNCYNNMFNGCTGITSVPSNYLPATTLAESCYNGMFNGCTGLTTAPTLPATTLATGCYANMFSGCTGITSVPSNYLPATTLAGYCYNGMFNGCTSLTTAPVLNATTLAEYCYGASDGSGLLNGMFEGCTSLTTAPTLPATTLALGCYRQMFKGCTSLTTVPTTLPATTVVGICYKSMFEGCTSLTTAPALPATTFVTGTYGQFYSNMFNGCTSLTTAPELPATTLAHYCYNEMFKNCTQLNNIKMLATNISATNCLNNWVQGVAATGTFTKDASMTTLPTGASGIPSGWTVVDDGGSSIPEGLWEFSATSEQVGQNNIINVEAFMEDDMSSTPQETVVNIYTDPNGSPVNTITYTYIAKFGDTYCNNTNDSAGLYGFEYSINTSTDPITVGISCRTAGTYYIEVVNHTNPRFYDVNGNQIYPDNA